MILRSLISALIGPAILLYGSVFFIALRFPISPFQTGSITSFQAIIQSTWNSEQMQYIVGLALHAWRWMVSILNLIKSQAIRVGNMQPLSTNTNSSEGEDSYCFCQYRRTNLHGWRTLRGRCREMDSQYLCRVRRHYTMRICGPTNGLVESDRCYGSYSSPLL